MLQRNPPPPDDFKSIAKLSFHKVLTGSDGDYSLKMKQPRFEIFFESGFQMVVIAYNEHAAY